MVPKFIFYLGANLAVRPFFEAVPLKKPKISSKNRKTPKISLDGIHGSLYEQ